jgi:hypothetical protein
MLIQRKEKVQKDTHKSRFGNRLRLSSVLKLLTPGLLLLLDLNCSYLLYKREQINIVDTSIKVNHCVVYGYVNSLVLLGQLKVVESLVIIAKLYHTFNHSVINTG